MASTNSEKVELIGVNSQSDTSEILKKLTDNLRAQGLNVVDDLSPKSKSPQKDAKNS